MTKLNKLLALASAAEAVTGLILIIIPSIAARLLFGEQIAGVAIVIGRVCGAGLLSLGLACWPGRNTVGNFNRALYAMLIYSFLVTIYLLYIGIHGRYVGPLLWPALLWHGAVTFLLVKTGSKKIKAGGGE